MLVFNLSNKGIAILFLLFIVSVSCKKEIEIKQNVVYDNSVYQLDTVDLYTSSADKSKEKSSTQYISILYTDLFQTTISAKELNDISRVSAAIGDKTVVNEAIVFNYMQSNPIIPTDNDMRNDMDQFIADTYVRFYLRKPTELERIYLRDLIENDLNMTALEVYAAFSVSTEYLFY